MYKKIVYIICLVSLPFSQVSAFSGDSKNNSWSIKWSWSEKQPELKSAKLEKWESKKYNPMQRKMMYRRVIEKKFWKKLEKLWVERLKNILKKIENFEKKLSKSSKYSEKKKRSILWMLEALTEIIKEKIYYISLDIESLMK
jgi:hypothetical protein